MMLKLNYAEASLLAALPKAPSKYNPYKNKKLAKIRRDMVLKSIAKKTHKKTLKKKTNTKHSLKKTH